MGANAGRVGLPPYPAGRGVVQILHGLLRALFWEQKWGSPWVAESTKGGFSWAAALEKLPSPAPVAQGKAELAPVMAWPFRKAWGTL